MQFVFIDTAGKTLFVRDDAERAIWAVEEYSLDLEFPYKPDKVITTGQRVFFKDPATGAHQIYEIKQAKTYQPDGYQQIVAEHICISELSDEHIDNKEVDNKKATTVLTELLENTLWEVGTHSNKKSSVSISRGSVWQAVLQVKANWNVYIEPRVTLANDGTITRKLDIMDTAGTYNGVRLSIDKNMLDPAVTYDDSELYTALYGYGGTITSDKPSEKDKECNFADVVWEKTDDHPEKPKGKKYLEDKDATKAYGRNKRPRFGFYQNNDIKDPEILLEKTWETLQTVSTPSISVEGTVADLYRLGYADQPLKLHDLAIVDVTPTGFKKEIQIIRLSVDLLDPTATTVTIGAYIPNIIYIERKTNQDATGSSGGGGGNTAEDNSWHEFRTSIQQINNGTALRFQSVQNDINNQEEEIAKQIGRIDVAYNEIRAEVIDRRNADKELSGRIKVTAENIDLEVKRASKAEGELSGRIDVTADNIKLEVKRAKSAEGDLSGRIDVTADDISAEVTRAKGAEDDLSGRIDVQADKISLVVKTSHGENVVNAASIVLGINSQNKHSSSYVDINADYINLTGYVTASQLSATQADIDDLAAGRAVATYLNCGTFRVGAGQFTFGANIAKKSTVTINGTDYHLVTWS